MTAPIARSVGPRRKTAEQMEQMLKVLYSRGNFPVLDAIAHHDVSLNEVFAAARRIGVESLTLETLGLALEPEPEPEPESEPEPTPKTMGQLVAAWTEWMATPGSVSPRTGRAFAPSTIRRYRESWEAILRHLPSGRDTLLDAFTRTAFEQYQRERMKNGISGHTLNRDWTAVQSHYRWIGDHHVELHAELPKRIKFKEPDDDPKYIPRAHLEMMQGVLLKAGHVDWWEFFEFLLDTGLRIAEAQYLERRDVNGEVVQVRANEHRRLKSPRAKRIVPLTETARLATQAHLARPGRPEDLLWPDHIRDYDRAYRILEWACLASGLHDGGAKHRARVAAKVQRGELTLEAAKKIKLRRLPMYSPHCCRHSYGFTLVDANVPVTTIRDLMGHSSITVTERYLKARSHEHHYPAVRAALAAAKSA